MPANLGLESGSLTSIYLFPTDFHAEPVFPFQVYLTVPLELGGPAGDRFRLLKDGPDAGRTVLHDPITYLGGELSESQLPTPLWEVYTSPRNGLDCVEHQRREIAHRKSQREDPYVVPIPKAAMPPLSYHGDTRTGCIIIVDTAAFADKLGAVQNPDTQFGFWRWDDCEYPLWVWFERKVPSRLSWEPHLRLDCYAPNLDNEGFGSSMTPRVLPEQMASSFNRVRAWEKINSELCMIDSASCAVNEPPASVDRLMSLAWDEDEESDQVGWFAAIRLSLRNLISPVSRLVITARSSSAALRLNGLHSVVHSASSIEISNSSEHGQPDLRYLIYAPFLHQQGFNDRIKETAAAFTYEIASRISPSKTVHFEFCKPPTASLSSILSDYKGKALPSDYLGALTTISSGHDSMSAQSMRCHPISREEILEANNATTVSFDPYHTFIVVLETADFAHKPGSVLFLLTDGGRPTEDRNEWDPGEIETYEEPLVLRSAGMDEVARRLQMDKGGIAWQRDVAQDREKGSVDLSDGLGETQAEEVADADAGWATASKHWTEEAEMSRPAQGKEGDW